METKSDNVVRLTMSLDLRNPIHKEIHRFFNAGPRKGVQTDIFVNLCQLYLNLSEDPNDECYRLMVEMKKAISHRPGAISETRVERREEAPKAQPIDLPQEVERKGSLASLGV